MFKAQAIKSSCTIKWSPYVCLHVPGSSCILTDEHAALLSYDNYVVTLPTLFQHYAESAAFYQTLTFFSFLTNRHSFLAF